MHDSVIDARPELARPWTFLVRAGHDLAAAPPIAWRLFRANLSAGRRRALFGWLWLLFPAASAMLVAVYLEQRQVVAVGATALPYALHVLAGMVLWQIFLDALNAPLAQLGAARSLIGRSIASHEAIILAGFAEVVLNAAVRLMALLIFAAAIGFSLAGQAMMLMPVGAVALMALGGATGIILAPLGLLFDDVRRGIGLAATFWFFLTPVLYTAPRTGLLRLNPVTPLLETARGSLGGLGAAPGFWPVAIGSAALLAIGWLAYRLARPHVIERLG